MFDADGTGMDALEIFKLKWSLFAQSCRAVFEYQRRCGVAHLRVEPRHLMVKLDEVGPELPAMWQFRTRLISLGSAVVENLASIGENAEILALPLNSNPVYDAEIICNSSFGVIQRGGFILKSIDPAPQEGKFIIRAEMHHDGIGLPWLSPKDRVKVILRNLYGVPGELAFMTQRDPEQEFSQGILFLQSQPVEIPAAKASALERVQGKKVHNQGFVLYPMFHVPCDVYSLGMLMFRTLVVNDKQVIGDVSLALEEAKLELSRLTTVQCEPGMESEFWKGLIDGKHRYNLSEIFNRKQVFYSGDDREAGRPNAIPTAIWSEAMVLGLQMITLFEGFSICSNHGDFDPRYPAGKMEPLVQRVEAILQKIDTALLSTSRRNAEIRAALEVVLSEGPR